MQRNLQQLPHILFDSLGIWSSEFLFQLRASLLLDIGHPPLPSQLTVGEIDDKIRVFLHGDVVMNREVLAVLERLEPIDNDFVDRRSASHHLLMEKHAVATQSCDVTIDGFLGHLQILGELSIGHATDSFHDDLGIEFRNLLPVGRGECLCTETAFTGLACKPLDTVWSGESPIVADLLVGPRIAGVLVVFAVGVGTKGRSPRICGNY